MSNNKQYRRLQNQIAEAELSLNLMYAELRELEEKHQHKAIDHLERYMNLATPKLENVRAFLRELNAKHAA